MAVTLLVPTTLRSFVDGQTDVVLDGNSIEEVLNDLTDRYPETIKPLFDESGKPRAFITFFLNGENIKTLAGLETPVKDGDEIMLVPAIAGGSGATHEQKNESVLGERRGESLTNDEITRYSRHLLLKEIGVKGQKRLKAASVLIIGVGGLGAPLAMYLAAAGVGKLGLIDFDLVDESNLQRQVIFGTRDVGRPKVAAAKDRLKQINPLVKVETYNYRLTAENAGDIFEDYDVIADASDNYQTRYLVNDTCVLLHKPDVFGAMYQFEGQVTVYYADRGPCYRCMFPAPPPKGLVPSCATGGVVGVLPGIIGTMQAGEVIKLIAGGGDPLIGRLVIFDEWNFKYRELHVCKDPDCPVCGAHPTITEPQDFDYDGFCGLNDDDDEIEIEGIEAKELKERMDRGERLNIVDVREPHERAICKFPEAHPIPIGQLARRIDEFDPEVDTIFICKQGQRSILAARTLIEAGYKGPVYNLKDGTNAWARDVDPSYPVY